MPITFGSLFSGAGGMDIGLERAGMECRWQCEIDPQASSVLARHWPGVTRFEDIRTVRKKDLAPVDVVVGGFPCQDLSVAGNRKGLSGERSGLFYELVRVVRLCKPRFVVWENVGGLLSSDDGRDFGRIIRALADIGYDGAWRVLDARFFGVPQRRRRVFGVFARGGVGAVGCGQILALTKGVCGHLAAGQKAGQDVAPTLTQSLGRSRQGNRVGNGWNTTYVAGTTFTELGEGHHSYQPTDVASGFRTHGGGGGAKANLVLAARCLTSRGQRNDAETDTLIAFTAKDHGGDCGSLAPTLRAGGFADSHANGGVMPAVCVPFTNRGIATDVAETVRASSHGALPPSATHRVVPFDMRQASRGETMTNNRPDGSSGGAPGTGIGELDDPSPTLAASHTPAVGFVPDVAQPVRTNVFNNSDPGMEATMHVAPAGYVRRLTPRECERLMSWPDDWTRWDADGIEFADGPRYRMIGNGVVANCAEWIGRRMVAFVESTDA